MSSKVSGIIRKALFLTGLVCVVASVVMLAVCRLSPHGELVFIIIIIVALAVSLSTGLQLRGRR